MSHTGIILLFRKRNSRQHSIERVFDQLLPFLREKMPVGTLMLPHSNHGTWNKVRNLIWLNFQSGHMHITGDVYYAALLRRKRFIATIHDIGVLSEVNKFKKFIIKLIWFDILAYKAEKLIFISNHSRSDFLNRVRTDVNKTVVIYNPLPEDLKSLDKNFNSGCPVILHFGTKSNKNIFRLCEALKGLNCQLVIVGQLSDKQKSALTSNKINYTEKINLSNEEVRLEYEKCDMLVFVSTHEGFGMPIIEAQAVGRPVITSNISSMPEIAGEAAIFVDPYNVDSIRKGILSIINDVELRTKLIEKGYENIRRFDARQIARQYLNIYKEVFEVIR